MKAGMTLRKSPSYYRFGTLKLYFATIQFLIKLCNGRLYRAPGQRSVQAHTMIDGPGRMCTRTVEKDTALLFSVWREVRNHSIRGIDYSSDSEVSPKLVDEVPARLFRWLAAKSIIATGPTKIATTERKYPCQTFKIPRWALQHPEKEK